MSSVSDTEYVDLKKKRETKRKVKLEKKADETESDSDFESIKMQTRGERQFLEDYLTLGELGGRIPPSMLVNVSFDKFAKENGFDLIDFEGNIQEKK